MRKRNVQILFRLTEEEAEHLNELVRKSGRSKEAFLREMVRGYQLCEKGKANKIGRSNIMERKFKRGDIYYANLNPVIGSEQGGTRPVLIISNDVGNKHSPTVIVAPITSRIHTKAKLPTHTLINDFEGLDKNSIILLEQVRTIDKQRLRQYLGMIPDDIVARVDKALAISVALEKMKATDV